MWHTITVMGYRVIAKVYKERSTMGIHGGRVSKLDIIKDGHILAHFDRGWDTHEIAWSVINKIVGVVEHLF